MNKKYFGTLLLGSLLLGSGAFVSCKDYDDDVDNLQGQIDKLASASELQSQVQTLSSQISAAQSGANSAATAAAAAQAAADAAQKVADSKLDEAAAKAIAEAAAEGAAKAAQEGKDAAAVAQAAAEAAQKAADAAQATADKGVTAAEAAQKAADAAAKAAQAATDKLADYATKSEVKAAQEVADAAKAAAAKAQTAADKGVTAAEAAQKTADAAKTAAAKVADDLKKLDARVKAIEEALANTDDDKLAELQKLVEALGKDADKYLAAYEAITSIDLYYNYSNQGGSVPSDFSSSALNLNFTKAIEKATKFGPKDEIVFEDGKVRTYTKTVTVRVSPTTAELTPDMIQLINSQGASLSEYVKVKKVSRANNLLTRGESGLWNVEFQLVEENFTDAKFLQATKIDSNWDGKLTAADKNICFAVAVNNTEAKDRLVVSAYDLIANYNDALSYDKLDFYVNNENVSNIHNRYSYCEDGTPTSSVAELSYTTLAWPGMAPVPSVKEKFVQEAWNVTSKYNVYDLKKDNGATSTYGTGVEDRQGKSLLVAGVGEDITIRVNAAPNGWGGWNFNGDIRALYVTFDEKNALESAPSEINAWNSYKDKIDNYATVVEGNQITIKVNDPAADGDVIGFRVYAVNLDGTVIDPDGRAFYVAVGNYAEAASVITANVTASKNVNPTSGYIEVPAGYFPTVLGNIALNADGTLPTTSEIQAVVLDNNNPKIGTTIAPQVKVVFYKDKNGTLAPQLKDAKFAKVTLPVASNYIDGQTYSQSIQLRRQITNGTSGVVAQYVPIKTITVKTTKVMPTTFPSSFAFRPMQETSEGSGIFRAYMVPGATPTNNDYTATSIKTVGSKDLNNVFYGLDKNYSFSIVSSVFNGTTWGYTDPKVVVYDGNSNTAPNGTTEDHYSFNIASDLIDGTTKHSIDASYLYRSVSSYWDAQNNTWVTGADYPVKYGKNLEVIYDCWFNASTFAWRSEKSGTGATNDPVKWTNKAPVLQWEAVPSAPVNGMLSDIVSTNSYNNAYFGTQYTYGPTTTDDVTTNDLAYMLTDPTLGKLALQAAPAAPHLKYGNQTDPYFAVSISGNTIIFTQSSTQVDANPVADHYETLEIPVQDAFGHKTTIKLQVLVKKAI